MNRDAKAVDRDEEISKQFGSGKSYLDKWTRISRCTGKTTHLCKSLQYTPGYLVVNNHPQVGYVVDSFPWMKGRVYTLQQYEKFMGRRIDGPILFDLW